MKKDRVYEEVLDFITKAELEAIENVNDAVSFVTYVRKWAMDRELHLEPFNPHSLCKNLVEEQVEATEAAQMYLDSMFADAEDDPQEAVKAYMDAIVDGVIYATVDTVRTHPDWKPANLNADNVGIIPLSALMSPVLPFISHVPPELRVLALATELRYYVETPFTSVIQEVLKEITSRRGEFSADMGKWVKDPTKPTYKADFQFDPDYVSALWQQLDRLPFEERSDAS